MAVHHLHEGPLRDQPFLQQPVDDVVVHEGGAAFVHDLGLFLRIKILGQIADDPNDLGLPRFQTGAVLFEEIKDVLLRQIEIGLPKRLVGVPFLPIFVRA